MIRNLFAAAVVLVLSGTVVAEVASSDTCGSCHRDIYRMWRDSAHAEASEDPFFTEVLREIRQSRGTEMTRLCLDCHAPMAVLADDLSMSRSASREGVSCEYCHGLKEVEITPAGARAVLEIGEIKRGTIAEADSPAHKVAFSELHRSARVCAPCHEYASPDGAAVLTTYSEWAASGAAERGETCQSCHMSITEGAVVDPRVQRDSVARVNLHEMPGGHSLKQLLKALNIKILPARDGDELMVEVTVKNVERGTRCRPGCRAAAS